MRFGGRFHRFLPMDDLDTTRWNGVQARDLAKDDVFVYAVRTTGIYCRPSCGARRPRRENVVFFSTPAAAIAEGFRACRRCHPDQRRTEDPGTASVLAVCRRLEHPDEDHDPARLAARVGWSKRHLQRRFAKTVGVSMPAYRRAMQAERVRAALRSGARVTAAVFDAGYGSARAFYEHRRAPARHEPRRLRRVRARPSHSLHRAGQRTGVDSHCGDRPRDLRGSHRHGS